MKTIQDINEFISLELQNKYNLVGDNLAMFMAQCHHESQGFTRVVENLNYSSADRLIAVFPKYFNKLNAWSYVNKPQSVANLVYANRMGNGDVDSGDGWNFRGSGDLMLTGRKNYTNFSNSYYDNGKLVNANDVANSEDLCLESALWVWRSFKLADCDIVTCTKRLNGGTNGLAERTKLFEYYKEVIKND